MKNSKMFLIGIFFLFLSFFIFVGCNDVLDNSGLLIADSDLTTDEQHIHTYSAYWTKDSEYHWHDATCFHNVISDKGAHQWDEGIVTQEPTESTDGIKTYTCDICGATKPETIEITHTHEYSSLWSYSDSQHWHAAVCGHNVQKDVATHIWDEGRITRQPTIAEYGVKVFTCSICGASKSERVDKLPHTHTFESTWSSDEDYHWHASACGHDEIINKEEHIVDEYGFCTVCDWNPYSFWELNNGDYEIGKYHGKQKDLTIPTNYNGRRVTTIGLKAFVGSDLRSVTIPDGITDLGELAFYGLKSLTTINLGHTIKNWSDRTFKSTGVKNIILSEGITKIGRSAFEDCVNLTSVIIYDVEEIGVYAFFCCTNLQEVSFGEKLKKISTSAFAYCSKLKRVNISSDVMLENNVFLGCQNLESVAIGKGVMPSPGAFCKCLKLKEITISNDSTVISRKAFDACPLLEFVVIPISITTIEANAFYLSSTSLSINYLGTKEQWKSINKDEEWIKRVTPVHGEVWTCIVHCTNGDIIIN